MKIVCATNIPFAREAFGTMGDVTVLPGREITAETVRDADILVLRSTTRVNAALLDGSRVRFVGTATIGTDHLDIGFLERRGIRWCASPGCNANSVSEYLVSALLCLGQRHGFALEGKTLGIIGVGNVGSRVAEKAGALGLRVLLNDPPKFELTGDSRFLPLDTLLKQSDILTLHVPLTKTGPHPTFHLADDAFFAALKPGCLFINAARGAVLSSDALLKAMDRRTVRHAVLDTWEGEPDIRWDLLKRTDLATPHIAGYSFDGMVIGTMMLYHELCRFLQIEPAWTPEALLPPPVVPTLLIDAAGQSDETVLGSVVRRVYDVECDDRRLRAGENRPETGRGKHFDHLRRTYPVRREFAFTRVETRNGRESLDRKLGGLGFGQGSAVPPSPGGYGGQVTVEPSNL
ncbi:MAG: 4-phosphoerythronate dehydrogenase PdxB [Lentisphaerae bacterium]|nr:4-phosphoerythronate dehydrogenase PdxB [Lentisphaerota bacterium]